MDRILREGLLRLRQGDPDIDFLFETRFDEILRLLNKYIEEIELFNPAYGLVGVRDRRELVVKHILDSLCPLGIVFRLLQARGPAAGGHVSGDSTVSDSEVSDLSAGDSPAGGTIAGDAGAPLIGGPAAGGPAADAGSGAGLPGIPLSIALPDCSFTLIERMGRRAGFLRNTLAVLALSNAAVEEGETEKAPAGRFSLITLRAFRPLEPAVLKGLFRLLAPGGVLAAYKGRREKIDEEMAAVRGDWEVFPLEVPFLEEERHLVVIPRVSPVK
jgi:16S rRNA (guanine527-N7)-methyltransferase